MYSLSNFEKNLKLMAAKPQYIKSFNDFIKEVGQWQSKVLIL